MAVQNTGKPLENMQKYTKQCGGIQIIFSLDFAKYRKISKYMQNKQKQCGRIQIIFSHGSTKYRKPFEIMQKYTKTMWKNIDMRMIRSLLGSGTKIGFWSVPYRILSIDIQSYSIDYRYIEYNLPP